MQPKHAMRWMAAIVAIALVTPSLLWAQDPVVQTEAVTPATNAQISWGAVFAGVVVALVTHLTLSTLGVGVGAAAIDPYDRNNPAGYAPTGVLVWMMVSGVVAMFAGGWVAGRLAAVEPTTSTIHGALMWGVATLVTFGLLASTVGYLVGGTVRLLGEGLGLTAQAAASAVPGAVNAVKDVVKDNVPQLDWGKIRQEAENLIEEAGGEEAIENVKEEGKKAAKRAARDPERVGQEIRELVENAYGQVRDNLNTADRDSLIHTVTKRTGMTKEEVTQTVERWEKMYREAKQQYHEAIAAAERRARDAADVAATAVSRVALWTFATLALGFAVAAVGGNLGSPFTRL